MRISDWSSDVCSSDLGRVRDARELDDVVARGLLFGARLLEHFGSGVHAAAAAGTAAGAHGELGQAPAAGLCGLADVAVGHAIADANVHGSENTVAAGPAPLLLRSSMIAIGRSPRRERLCHYE